MKPAIIKPDCGDERFTAERCHILELVNTPTDPSISIARARVGPGVATVRHVLEGIDERYLIVSGTGAMEVAGGPPQAVKGGDLVLIPAGCSQRITNTGTDDLIFYCICSPGFRQDAYRALE